jgi:hypothetical protein
VAVLTEIPDELRFRGIPPPEPAHGFQITLDRAEPWGGGQIEGRVERRGDDHDRRAIVVRVRCLAMWLEIAPQLVGREPLLSWSTLGDIRNRAVPIWLDEEAFVDSAEVGVLEQANWQPFAFDLPRELPRAFEGTFVAFRWIVEARRPRLVGGDVAGLPLLILEPLTLPVVRIETTPIGTWRLLEWRSELDIGGSAGPCSVSYEQRRAEDMPLPGETREQELARRVAGA